MSSGPLPPIPDLIPITSFKSSLEVMGEQRSRRPPPQPAADLIDTRSSSSTVVAAAAAAPPRKARSHRHRKSDKHRHHHHHHHHHHHEEKQSARVNPIFVWVRQEDTRIVDVKCEDYDKRNRILLTKTAAGWRAIPRTETLAAKDHHHHHHNHRNRKRRKSKIRRKSTGVQVESDFDSMEEEEEAPGIRWSSPVNIESHLPSHKIHVPKNCNSSPPPPTSAPTPPPSSTNEEDVVISPLDNLLAVAEFEFNQLPNDDDDDDDQKDFMANMEQLIDSCSKTDEPISLKGDECDYNEDDDNNIAMDDILSRLEQSLQSPEPPKNDKTKEDTEEDEELESLFEPKEVVDEPTDLSVKIISEQPTDLSVQKARPSSQNSEAGQSPQPSGIPAPSPDLVVTTTKPKSRKTPSPTVSCSEEAPPPPPKKCKPSSSSSAAADTPRLLELLKNETGPDALSQLRQVLADSGLSIPDPMLVPKERLSQIISSPGREIPRLLKQRPELRLPEALAFPHLLQDPDILVITLQQLETIILKQNQTLKDAAASIISEPKAKPSLKPENRSVKQTLAGDIDAATAAAFNQMIWMPYFDQLQMFGSNAEMVKMLTNPLYAEMAPRFPTFGPSAPPVSYNNLELSMWQEAMLQAHQRPKQPFRDYGFGLKPPPLPPAPVAVPKMSKPNYLASNYHPNAFINGSLYHQGKGVALPQHYQAYNNHVHQKNTGGSKKAHHHHHHRQHHEKSFFHHQQQHHHHHNTVIPPVSKSASSAPLSKSFSAPPVHRDRMAVLPPPPPHHQQQHQAASFVQPIDLSGSMPPRPSNNKVKQQHLIDPKLMVKQQQQQQHQQDDSIGEVGSTTASVEEMQDAHKHLWHPLFGNQKGYHNPWKWTTVTATGE